MIDEKENGFLDDIDESEEELELEEDVLSFPDIDAVLKERDQLKDRLLRAFAETENLRKRSERDRRDAEVYGGTKLARDLLSVQDNLERALENIDDDLRKEHRSLTEGLELTLRELLSVFEKHKIVSVAPAIGDKFNPKLHQAMFEAPVPNTTKGAIIQVMATGFAIGDRLLRAAQVGVSSNPSKPSPVKEEAES
ncbi:nucleotide exchange factor GrpE [Rhodobacterales bacterium 52_120_T64]|nr:nucleotide exchange factor GrpE [Rhodobacterales bacterium 52_120_T64]